MPETTDDDLDYAERIAAHADRHRNAWQRTLADLTRREAELDDDGYDVVAIAAGHVAPVHPDAGETDRFGLVHVIPGNDAEAFREAFDAGDYPEFQVYRTEVTGRVFLVTELRDPESRRAILLAGNYELRKAAPLVTAAKEVGETYTHVQTLDETYLGSFRHEAYEKFFPHADRIEEFSPAGHRGVGKLAGEKPEE